MPKLPPPRPDIPLYTALKSVFVWGSIWAGLFLAVPSAYFPEIHSPLDAMLATWAVFDAIKGHWVPIIIGMGIFVPFSIWLIQDALDEFERMLDEEDE